jgi:hypothetical protein
VEREHAAGQVKLREASERYEHQLTMQRMRLVSDGDLRLEQLEASRCVGVGVVLSAYCHVCVKTLLAACSTLLAVSVPICSMKEPEGACTDTLSLYTHTHSHLRIRKGLMSITKAALGIISCA